MNLFISIIWFASLFIERHAIVTSFILWFMYQKMRYSFCAINGKYELELICYEDNAVQNKVEKCQNQIKDRKLRQVNKNTITITRNAYLDYAIT